MHVSDRIIYLFLFLVGLSLIGMILQSWRMILYPYLIVIGITILIGMWKSIIHVPKKICIPISVSIIYFILYGLLDILSLDSIADKDYYIFGMTPTMALYLIAILPSAVIICLLYAITFTHGNMSNNTNENHELDEVIK
ncbi:hypothetical protein [Virgibacillus alimentarius]|uniref:hypothetical protein n=1 Tax=Virgibacillus alimentarius TaxID=698769 RepID=UPI0004933628|nr:hypothetical protein [Virgibacillus alimentarius]